MHHLSIADLQQIIDDLLEHHLEDLRKLRAADLFLPTLREDRARLHALGAHQADQLPFSAELDVTDRDHDDFGWAIWHACEAHKRSPLASEATREAAARIQHSFIPDTGELDFSYLDEANNAESRRSLIEALSRELALIPVGDGHSLRTWVEGFINKGATLRVLIQRRAQALKASEQSLRKARADILGNLQDLRDTIRLEARRNADLDPDYEGRVFALADQLSRERRQARLQTP